MRERIKVVLDSNEILFGLSSGKPYPKVIIDNLNALGKIHDFFINGQIFEEVSRNLPFGSKEKFRRLVGLGILKLSDSKIGKGIIAKYERLWLKKGDIAIAAFADRINAQFLLSENRHFLKEVKIRKFKILTAEQFFSKIAEIS